MCLFGKKFIIFDFIQIGFFSVGVFYKYSQGGKEKKDKSQKFLVKKLKGVRFILEKE